MNDFEILLFLILSQIFDPFLLYQDYYFIDSSSGGDLISSNLLLWDKLGVLAKLNKFASFKLWFSLFNWNKLFFS